MNGQLTLVIGGDTVPTRSNEDYLMNGREAAVFNGVKDVFSSADLAMVNLECALTQQERAIQKAGPHIKARPEAICGLVNAGINVFSLANNHILDYGEAGVYDTLSYLHEQRVYFTGAGKDRSEARQVLFIEKNGCKVAVIAVAEHEFASAKVDAPGANRFDPFDTLEDVRRARAAADLVIVLYHAGVEHYPLPTPGLQRACRKLVESGAGYVLCQHSHCVGAYEAYQGGYIVYGQGNLLFDYLDKEEWQSGLLVKIIIKGSESVLEFLPVVKKGFAIDLAKPAEKEKILAAFEERSRKITDPQYVEKEWIKLANTRKFRYLQAFLGISGLIRRVDNKLGHAITKRLINPELSAQLYNFMTCDSNLEMVRTILENQPKKA